MSRISLSDSAISVEMYADDGEDLKMDQGGDGVLRSTDPT
jgi:hypothetical protein